MTGLEKIVKAIEEEASVNAEKVISKAKLEAEKILEEARVQADKKCAEIALKSEADKKDMLSRAQSAAQLLEKKAVLNAKQQIINAVISKAQNSLHQLSDAEYTDMIVRMIKKYAHSKQGVIQFCAVDRKRFPENFASILNNALADRKDALLICSEEEASIDGGFLLRYGDIEENCSFDALFSTSKEELQDKVNSFLFKQG